MATEPVNAAYKFAELLRDHITRLENLNSLHVGYTSGGEHQPGVFGRNQHILPAPVTSNPREWLIAQNASMSKPQENTMFTFPHIRTMTFENCWFSPYMLETFMHKSRDTSLHNLVLDSVSLTSQINSTRTDGPLRTIDHGLKCQHTPSAWLNETVPANASWVDTLDKITPGSTILDMKYDAGIIDEEKTPRPEKQFRGNIQQIVLKSCGYVKILGIPSNEFNQNELVFQNSSWCAMDDGLTVRSLSFDKTVQHAEGSSEADDYQQPRLDASFRRVRATAPTALVGGNTSIAPRLDRAQHKESQTMLSSRNIMLASKHGHLRSESMEGGVTVLLGFLTQCIHPVEQRILERMWGMNFGWGDAMERWEAVEDGCFVGGTGRFSGDVDKVPRDDASSSLPTSSNAHACTQHGLGSHNMSTAPTLAAYRAGSSNIQRQYTEFQEDDDDMEYMEDILAEEDYGNPGAGGVSATEG